jgi:hypothetical protein
MCDVVVECWEIIKFYDGPTNCQNGNPVLGSELGKSLQYFITSIFFENSKNSYISNRKMPMNYLLKKDSADRMVKKGQETNLIIISFKEIDEIFYLKLIH